MLYKLRNKFLSEIITNAIMYKVVLQPDLIGLFLQSKPFAPDEYETCLTFSGFMGCVIPLLTDERSIRSACYYVSNLLITFKKNYELLLNFCNEENIIYFLLENVLNGEDETCISAIRLLINLLKLQVRKYFCFFFQKKIL